MDLARIPRPDRSAAASGEAIRVFVIDDSSLVRVIFASVVESTPGLELAGSARSAEDAIEQLGSLGVDVILLDLQMPGMGGLAALPRITRLARRARILVVSSLTAQGAEHTIRALAAGAADTLLKPDPGGFGQAYRDLLVERIRALGKRPRPQTQGQARSPVPSPVVVRRAPSILRARVIAIGASTGGVQATGTVLGGLSERIGVPILITQHLPALFSQAYAKQLRQVSGRDVAVAEDGMPLEADRVLLAPGDAHLCLRKTRHGTVVKLDRTPSPSGCMPSVDAMFTSLAQIYGGQALGVVLTGMGRDGTEGARALAGAGSAVLVQDEASSVVWGMPGSIARAGLAAEILQPHDIADRIATRARPD